MSDDLMLAKSKIKNAGLEIAENATYEEWEQIGKTLNRLSRNIMWWVGDWLLFGERKYGEMYAQAMSQTEYEYGTLRNAAYVAERFELSRRRDNLSWSHHQELAALEPAEQNKLLDDAEQEGLSKAKLRAVVRGRRTKQLREKAVKMPSGKFAVIYADPPWQYSNSGFDEAAESQYPTMPLEEICDMRDMVNEWATDSTVLFLWATNPLLLEALEVMSAWGFTYKTNIAWVKDKGRGKGWYLRSKHELLLIGTKQNTPHPKIRPDSCQSFKRPARHSQKPEEFYELIESMYDGNKIEMFCRMPQKGWSAHGNEI